MSLYELFEKPIDREIEGVIKADDLEELKTEIEEYVITNEISREIEKLFEIYNEKGYKIGVWISGFFGSGKSHLLKILSFLLENRVVDGKPTFEYFVPKLKGNALLKGTIKKAVTIPTESVLFNIDQKADTISHGDFDAVLAVFAKVFNEIQGYYGKLGYVAEFEKHLNRNNLLQEFRGAYSDIAGKDWSLGRELVLLEKENISKAYAQVAGVSKSSTEDIIDEYRQDYKLSIEDFANNVNDYIQKQEKGFRLNFFVDEVGQYIADSVKLMTNLQTIAESLATKCKGQAWIFVTAQEDMERVIGDMEEHGHDFSKIQDRFTTRLKLTSANVDEVIQTRLLKKNEKGAELCKNIYNDQKNNFGTFFGFSDGSPTYRNFRDENHFILTYPFVPYQFSLFQTSIESLSTFNAFEGKHRSVGERSMLGVFQDVVIEIGSKEPGELATFDLMFNGIKSTLKTQVVSSVRNAEEQLDSEFAKRVLKALFLVKYVRGFRATPRNLRVLMQDRFSQDLPGLQDDIEDALAILEQQTYIQRNGDVYEYLTDEEKDIETEIKNTEVDNGEVVKTLDDVMFTEILRDRKIRYGDTNQDYPFTRKIDNRQLGREHELSIHFITPFSEHDDDPKTLQAHAMGRPELTVLLPPDERFLRDVLLHKKTEKYIRLNQSSSERETIRRILGEKALQNTDRFKIIQQEARNLAARANFFVSGDEIEISGEDPQTRIIKAFNELIKRVYPNLRMLTGGPYREEEIGHYLQLSGESSMFGEEPATFSEAEQEILTFIRSDTRNGIRTTLKSIEEKFTTRPYGWYLAAIQCTLAMLLGRLKVEARSDGNLLEGDSLVNALKNTRGFGNVILEPAPDVPIDDFNQTKTFFSNFFDRPPSATEARALGREIKEVFRELFVEVEVIKDQERQYSFLTVLEKPLKELQQLLGKPYDYFFTEDFRDQNEQLLKMKTETIDPIRRFMRGSHREIFDQATSFMNRQEPNFTYVPGEADQMLRAMMESEEVYRGGQMKEIKEQVEILEDRIDSLAQDEKTNSMNKLKELHDRLHHLEEYQSLPAKKKGEVDQRFDLVRNELKEKRLIPVIRETVTRFEDEDFRKILTDIAVWSIPEGGDGDPTSKVEYVSFKEISFQFESAYLATEDDVESYVSSLKKALMKAISENKRIQV